MTTATATRRDLPHHRPGLSRPCVLCNAPSARVGVARPPVGSPAGRHLARLTEPRRVVLMAACGDCTTAQPDRRTDA